MKKSDLKSGMVVKLNNGCRYLVLVDMDTHSYGYQRFILVGSSNFMISSNYDDNMKCIEFNEYTINKVYKAKITSLRNFCRDLELIWERKEPEYIDLHEQSGFKVGHIVKIVKSAKSYENGWNNSWTTGMNYTVGKTGYIVNDKDEEGFYIRFNNGLSYYYPYFVLELVD